MFELKVAQSVIILKLLFKIVIVEESRVHWSLGVMWKCVIIDLDLLLYSDVWVIELRLTEHLPRFK